MFPNFVFSSEKSDPIHHLALSLLLARMEKLKSGICVDHDCVCVTKSAAPSADRALRHRGCTIEVSGSCFPAIAGTGPVAKSGPPKLAERRTRVIILIQYLMFPNFGFSSEKKRSNASFCIVPFAGSNKKIEKTERDCVCVTKSAAPSADRALRHRGCTIEVSGSCFPAIAGTGPVAKSGPPKLAGSSDAHLLYKYNVMFPNFGFSSEKSDPIHHFALSRLRDPMTKIEMRNMRRP